jgi:HEAT repeat protein
MPRDGDVRRIGRIRGIGPIPIGSAHSLLSALSVLSVLSVPPVLSVSASAQVPFEEASRDLASSEPEARLRAVQLLRDAAYPEAALPLARAILDTQDEVQLAAIAAELNIFLAEKIVPRKRVALVVEVRNQILAEPAFTAGPSVLGSLPVPPEVLDALRFAARDDNPRVAIEALYAFGVLGDAPAGVERRELLGRSGPDVAALLGAADPAKRYGAARVMGRLFAKRAHDDQIDSTVGDAVITALNDSDRAVKNAAMSALGSMRYERGVQALTDLFTFYGRGDNAEAALDALAHIAHPASVPLFVAQLTGRNTALRAIAIEALARVGDPARLPEITAAADADRGDVVTLAAAFASAMLENGSVERIVAALTKPRFRDRARQYVTEIAPRRAAVFGPHLMDPDERIRLEIVEALGVAGDRAALPLIEPLLQDRDAQVMRAAERAVARLRSSAP